MRVWPQPRGVTAWIGTGQPVQRPCLASPELPSVQRHHHGVPGPVGGQPCPQPTRAGRAAGRAGLRHGRRPGPAGAQHLDLPLLPGPRAGAAQPHRPPGAEAQLAPHPQGGLLGGAGLARGPARGASEAPAHPVLPRRAATSCRQRPATLDSTTRCSSAPHPAPSPCRRRSCSASRPTSPGSTRSRCVHGSWQLRPPGPHAGQPRSEQAPDLPPTQREPLPGAPGGPSVCPGAP